MAPICLFKNFGLLERKCIYSHNMLIIIYAQHFKLVYLRIENKMGNRITETNESFNNYFSSRLNIDSNSSSHYLLNTKPFSGKTEPYQSNKDISSRLNGEATRQTANLSTELEPDLPASGIASINHNSEEFDSQTVHKPVSKIRVKSRKSKEAEAVVLDKKQQEHQVVVKKHSLLLPTMHTGKLSHQPARRESFLYKADIEFDVNQKSSLRKSSMASGDIQGGRGEQ